MRILKKRRFVCVFFALCVVIQFFGASCTVFTTSAGKTFRRSQSRVLQKASAAELIAFSRLPYASSPETMKALMDLLSKKDHTELTALSLSDKEAVLKLAMDVSFPIKTLKIVVEEALSALDEGISGEEIGKIIIKLIDGVNTFDTGAVSFLLTDTEVMRAANPSVLTDAAVALLIQMSADIYDSVAQNIDFKTDDVNTIIHKILDGKPGYEEKKESLKASLTIIKLLSGLEVVSSGGISVKRIFDASEIKFIGLIPLDNISAGFGK